MSLRDDASLILIPSAIKGGEVLVQKPLPNKFSDETGNYDGNDPQGSANLTFTRNSNATRVDADGLVEKVRTNSLLQSNSFDTTWLNAATTETGGQAGYDGSNDAWRIDKSNTGAYIIQTISVSGINTFSVYAKAGTLDWIRLNMNFTSGTDPIVYFDLANGAIGSTPAGQIDAQIVSVGNGWYRCSVAGNGTIQDVRFFPANADNDVSGTSGNIYIQDAQLEQGLVATSYIETTTTAMSEFAGVTASSVADVPRLDYSGGSCPSLLLEPQRTQLLTQSEYITGGDSNTTTTFNYGVSPDGYNNSIKVQVNADGYAQKAQSRGGLTANTTYTFSFWLSSESDSADIRVYDNSNGANIINPTALTIPTSGWERVVQTFTTPTGCTSINLYCLANGGKTAGDKTITWGWQLEAGSYPTSYIPTYGTTVTRLADACSKTGISSLIGQTEGTLFAEFEIDADNTNGYNRVLAVGDGTANNRIFIFAQNTEVFRFYVTNGGTAQVDIVSSTSILGGRHKVAFAYKANDFIAYVDGVQVGSDTSGTVPACSNVYVGTHESGSTQPLEGGINQAVLFKTRLSNADLANLTTL